MRNKIIYLWMLLVISACGSHKNVVINVKNPVELNREHEVIEVDWKLVQKKSPSLNKDSIIIVNEINKQVPFQFATCENGKDSILIFLADLPATSNKNYFIKKGQPETFDNLVYGRLIPERKDDFAWENNRVAYRIYGPALQATGEISNGMDYWAKSTEDLIINKWYANDLAGIASYHQDHGEGLDFYKVGRTLGLGMTAPYINDKLWLGDNFVSVEIINAGPLRFTFKVHYKPYNADDHLIKETRVISLNAYSHLNKVTNRFESVSPNFQIATGIVMSNKNDTVFHENDEKCIVAYELPADKINGTIFTGAINPEGFDRILVDQGHYLGVNNYQSGKNYTYYAGGAWNKGFIKNFTEWIDYLKNEVTKLKYPIQVKIK